MKKKFFFSLCVLLLATSLFGNQPTYFYNIDASLRGMDIYTAFLAAVAGGTAIYSPSGPTTTQEVAIQTIAIPTKTLFNLTIPNYIPNGLISWVNDLTPAPNFTLFILSYAPPGLYPAGTSYCVVGVEHITDVFYTPFKANVIPPIPPSGFSSTFYGIAIPSYNIDPFLRAADIVFIVTTMITPGAVPYLTQNPNSEVWIQTTLNGQTTVNGQTLSNFNPPIQIQTGTPPKVNIQGDGFIPDIQSISILSGSLLLILYKPHGQTSIGSLIVSAEQVQQIYYYPDASSF
jgi:hypothetical protein